MIDSFTPEVVKVKTSATFKRCYYSQVPTKTIHLNSNTKFWILYTELGVYLQSHKKVNLSRLVISASRRKSLPDSALIAYPTRDHTYYISK